MKVRVVSGKHYRMEAEGSVRYLAGETFEATEEEVKAFKGRLEAVDEAEEPATIDSGENGVEIPGVLAETDNSGTSAEPGEATGGFMDPADELKKLLNPKRVKALEAAGVSSLGALSKLAADPQALEKVPGIGKSGAKLIRQALIAVEIPTELQADEPEKAE